MAETASVESDRYLWSQLRAHVGRFFSRLAVDAIDSCEIEFLPFEQACAARGRRVVIPSNGEHHVEIGDSWQVGFNGTKLTLWSRLRRPYGAEWQCIPSESAPLWYLHESGTLLPAYDMRNNVLSLLVQDEEAITTHRDRHGRFVARMSPRYERGVIDVPVFNEAAAVLVAAAMSPTPHTLMSLHEGVLKPPTVVLSHDVDSLLGGEFWTQLARLARMMAPLKNRRPPDMRQVGWFLANIRDPRRYYMADVERIVEAEREHGFTSAFYFLVGKRGRYGARYGVDEAREAIRSIPDGWVVGAHYSYYAHLESEVLEADLRALEGVARTPVTSGRAHYLRYDPNQSPCLVAKSGILIDESIGYPDAIGYRAGIAGPYELRDVRTTDGRPLTEMPLVVMDSALRTVHGQHAVGAFQRVFEHIVRIGGAVSLLTHTGTMANPEHSESEGLYEDLLRVAAQLGARGVPATQLLADPDSGL